MTCLCLPICCQSPEPSALSPDSTWVRLLPAGVPGPAPDLNWLAFQRVDEERNPEVSKIASDALLQRRPRIGGSRRVVLIVVIDVDDLRFDDLHARCGGRGRHPIDRNVHRDERDL